MQGFFQRYLLLYRPLTSKLNELLGEYELSYSLWQIIFHVKNNGPSTLAAISDYFNIERPSVTRAVQRLEEKQIIEQIPGRNKREKMIQLTELGEDVYLSCREQITTLENSVMKDIPKEELNAAYEVLPKIRENMILRAGEQNE